MLQIHKDRSVIKQELDSLAAIARDAGIDPEALSGFLEVTQGLSSESLDRLNGREGM